ncbi:DNA polymerase [Bacillus atrophaeus]|uniref:DNA polymerase I n=1 Tax=Bacillus atrophaeus (strain 1942) TaxID=720555 RepID=A0ABM5LYC0_BACA1|nr:DNA polymerase [Bacillus atrophaeus]AMR62338.1 DNA polymerase [Bacillus subtilis subsp. globigii]ADP32870.1 DNA-directed DNA polymerase [Bacillus atrophaeus 1942]AIK47231.1 3'-5' exonuclease family protein [Bacillus atrophaeus subsp. globigii]EIM12010.1 DNA-directed DNA polymerase [Bacillus atrophaeus C89]KFK83915.1 3'-5' exonuclease family protein [Bacillus atrophaeus]
MEFFKGVSFETGTKGDALARVSEAQKKKELKNYEPTWEEVWLTGYPSTTGKHKNGIFQTKITPKDKDRLLDVKTAIEAGQLGMGVESLKKFSKAHALNLYKQLAEARKAEIIKGYLANMPENYHTVNTHEGMEWVLSLFEDSYALGAEVALDTETTGVEWWDRTVGLSLTFEFGDVEENFYIPYGHTSDHEQLTRGYVMKKLKPHLEKKGTKLVLHNSKFDSHMLLKDGITIRNNIYFDTMIAHSVLNENDEKGLKAIATKYGRFFGFEDKSMSFGELFSNKPEAFYSNESMELCTFYACKDTHLCLKLYKWQLSMMKKQPKLYDVYFNYEQPLTPAVLAMEETGFEIDFSFADMYKTELQAEVSDLEQKMTRRFGEINLNSPAQLSALLYDELKLPDISGKRKADAKTLQKLVKHESDLKLILEYRDLNKLLTTYVEPLPEKVNKNTGKLHSSFNQSATVTSRFASKDPNLQNLPPKARKLIVAPKGYLIFGIDYSQIEPRTLAHMSGDAGLQYPYLNNIDLYASLASKIFKLPYEACLEADGETYKKAGLPKHPRKMMKVGLLAVMYGITVPSLAESLGISVPEAQKFMDDFYSSYPEMTAWMAKQVAHADETGYVETMQGRKRRFIGHTVIAKHYHALHAKVVNILGREPENIWREPLPRNLKKQYWEVNKDYQRVARMSVNAIIQGSAALMLKKAMIAVNAHLERKGAGWKMMATIHDELLFLIPEAVTPEEIIEIENIMKDVVKLDVPLKVDTEVMIRWGEGIPFAEWVEKGCGRKPFEEVA